MMRRHAGKALGVAAVVVALAASMMLGGAPAGAAAAVDGPREALVVARELLANCQAQRQWATTSGERTRADQCATIQRKVIAGLTPTPAPTPSGSVTAAPSPTVTASPTPPSGGLRDCMRQLGKCGWPTEASTGPAPFAPLTTYPGLYPLILRAGQAVERMVINGCVRVDGSGVILRDVIIRPTASTLCGTYGAIDMEDGAPRSGVLIERAWVDLASAGAGRFGLRAISGDGFTLDHVKCTGGGDCVHYGGDVVVRDSYFEVPECVAAGCSSLHIDAIHSSSGHPDPAKRHVLIQHNTIIMWGTGSGHPNSAIINGPDIGPYAHPQDVVIIRENLMAGGGAVIYCAAHPEDTPSHTAEIWGNRISDLVWPRGGRWGPFYDDCMNPPAPGRLTNVWDRTGEVIALGSWA